MTGTPSLVKRSVRGGLIQTDEVCSLDRESLGRVLHSILSKMTLEEFARLFYDPVDLVFQYIYLLDGKGTCRYMSLMFNPHRLDVPVKMVGASSRAKSVFQSIRDIKYSSCLARAYLRYSERFAQTQNLLKWAVNIGMLGVSFAQDFPPALARKLALENGCTSESHVLDPCAGWGGRMIGLSTLGCQYTCYEPATRTYRGLRRLRRYLHNLNPEFRATVVCQPYEDTDEKLSHYDFAFTSPPYYDTEAYSDEPTNSLNRYATFDAWVEGFFHPLIDKTMRQLKPGAVFVLNVGNRRYPLDAVCREHADGKYSVENQGNRLSGKGGLRRKGVGEVFLLLRRKTGR